MFWNKNIPTYIIIFIAIYGNLLIHYCFEIYFKSNCGAVEYLVAGKIL